MSFLSHAQNFEDVLLWRALNDIPNGRYLDIGAQDPEIDSVSFAFYQAGWRGIHVEPTPHFAARLRSARPDEMVVEAAITCVDGPIKFFDVLGTGLSTGRPDIAQEHAQAGFEQREIVVACARLDQLFQMAGEDQIHWMKVDVEGMEAEVLKSWGENSARPWILVIESTHPNSSRPTQDQWLEEVVTRGYREVHFDGLSRFFVHELRLERAAAFETPTNIFDNFVVTRHHFATRSICSELELIEQRLESEQVRTSELTEQLTLSRARIENSDAHISKLQSQLVGSEVALVESRAEQAAMLERLAQSEREHRISLESHWNERFKAETELRLDHRMLEEELRRSVTELSAARSALAEELAVTRALRERDKSDHDHLASRLHSELSRQRNVVLRADLLIRRLRESRRSRLTQIGQGLGLLKPSPVMRALSDWAVPQDGGADDRQFASLSDYPPESELDGANFAVEPNPYLRANSLAELCAFHDVHFVRCAFVTILGRQPDSHGESYYVDRVRQGHSKLEILWQLRRSTEGKKHDPGIAGLDRALKRAAWERKRLVGNLIRAFTGGEPDDQLERLRRSSANDLWLMKQKLRASHSQPIQKHDVSITQVQSFLESGFSTPKETVTKEGLSPASRESLEILEKYKSR